MQPNFYLTSVYDHSLHEAFSRVLHKLIDSLPYLEDMLNVFCAVRSHLGVPKSLTQSNQNSQSPKAFLFDTKSRLYIATDESPVDSATHNLCCDYLEMLTSFNTLYKCVNPYLCSTLIADVSFKVCIRPIFAPSPTQGPRKSFISKWHLINFLPNDTNRHASPI